MTELGHLQAVWSTLPDVCMIIRLTLECGLAGPTHDLTSLRRDHTPMNLNRQCLDAFC